MLLSSVSDLVDLEVKDFFLPSKLCVCLEISLVLIEICKLCDLVYSFCVNKNKIGLWSVYNIIGCLDL